MSVLHAVREGFAALRRSWGLTWLLWAVNVAFALTLAAPLAARLERDLANRQAGSNMMYGFDYAWWSRWWEQQSGWTQSFAPEIFGVGFALRNVELVLKGQVPAGLNASPPGEPNGPADLDGVVLGLGMLYLLAQTFLAGGVLGALRGQQGEWTLRGLLHGSGFYFGRFLRLAVLALLAACVVFQLHAPLARWADHQAQEAVSGRTALAWTVGHNLALLAALLFLHMVSCYAKVIVVLEERSSAILAYLSALSFCASRLLSTFGHYLLLSLMGVGLLAVWHALASPWAIVGYRTQLVWLLLSQALMVGRLALRLALLGGQIALYRRHA
jgi:hypothetical protein